MANSLKYKIIADLKVIVEYYEGRIFLNDMIEFETREMKDKEYYPQLNMIADLRNAELLASDKDVIEFADFMKKTKELLAERKVAIVTNTPYQAALTTLYSLYTADSPLNNKVFSTLEAAMKWIGLPESKQHIIEETFENLRKS